MFSILICDDDIRFCSDLEHKIENWGQKNGVEVLIEPYYSGEKICKTLCNMVQKPDLIFLDIELGEESGINIGNFIREKLKDEKIQIIFVSSYESYAIKLFEIRPFDFLVKPVQSESLEKVLTKYNEIYGQKNEKFVYKIRKQIYKIPLKKIIYMKSAGKKIQIVTVSGTREYTGVLSEAVKQLDDRYFWIIHKSFVVNVEFVSDFGRCHFGMYNGEELPVSPARWKEVQDKITQYLVGGK